MPTDITINTIGATPPYNIYVCDNPITICIYIDTINSLPYSFQIPDILNYQNEYNLKIIDNTGCEILQYLTI